MTKPQLQNLQKNSLLPNFWIYWRCWCLVEKLILNRDSEDEIWSRFVFELVIWPKGVTLVRWTQSSGPLCLWQCLRDTDGPLAYAAHISHCLSGSRLVMEAKDWWTLFLSGKKNRRCKKSDTQLSTTTCWFSKYVPSLIPGAKLFRQLYQARNLYFTCEY